MATPDLSRLGHPLPRKIGVLRALQLGDLLCAVPALRALRAALPQASVTLIGLPWARAFVSRFARYLDDFCEFPGAPGLPERVPAPGALERFFLRARQASFDLAIQLHGDGRVSNSLVGALGAQRLAGFHPAGTEPPDEGRFLAYPERLPEVQRHLRLMEYLGIPAQGEHLEFPLSGEERRRADVLRGALGLGDGDYVCLHPGARAPARRWPAEAFAAVGDGLAATGLRVVLTGTGEERALTAAVADTMRQPSIDLAGATSLGVLAGLLSGARVVVCNDTGISHLAAALRVPSVVVFSASSPQRWAPQDRLRHRSVFRPVPCRPCSHHTCPIGHLCADTRPEDVLRQAASLLDHREERCVPYGS